MKEIKVGLVGCGVISVTHLKAWKAIESASITGVFDLDGSLAEKRAAQFGGIRVYTDLEELIEDCNVIDVCTPPHTHSAIANQVISAGRHLLIEKPLVTELEDWEQLSALIARAGVKVSVVHNLKFVRSVQKAKQWVDEGRIGRVIGVSRQFLTNPAADRMLDAGGHWSHRLPGGRWFETLPHELYLTHYFAGPLSVADVTVVKTSDPPPGVSADEVLITLRGEESLGMIHYSGNCALNRRMLFIYGSTGLITVDLLSDAIHISRISDSRKKRAVGRLFLEGMQVVGRMIPDRFVYVQRQLAGRTPHAAIIKAFATHLEGRGPEPTPLDEIDYVVRNCDKIGKMIDQRANAGAIVTEAFVSG